jgi:hypothetical protein
MNQSETMNQDLKNNSPPALPGTINETHLYLHSKSEKCVFNEYGQCIKGFRYFCSYCNYGLGGMFSLCNNIHCNLSNE